MDGSGGSTTTVWYKTWRGRLIGMSAIAGYAAVVWTKPDWIKISLANCNVALLSIGLADVVLRVRPRSAKYALGLLWILFLPNAAYLFTDVGHIPYQWSHTVSAAARGFLIAQYVLMEWFAGMAFLFSLLPFEQITAMSKIAHKQRMLFSIALNFVIAYGVVLGRFEHVNSWVLMTHPGRALGLALHIFGSMNLLRLVLEFGMLLNAVYFLFGRTVKKCFAILDIRYLSQ